MIYCPICNEVAVIDSYIRDDKRRFRVVCPNKDCECFPVRGREYDSFDEAVRNWNGAYTFRMIH
jgi:hypothetical protein